MMAAVPAVISFLFMLWDMWQVGSRPAGNPEATGSPQEDAADFMKYRRLCVPAAIVTKAVVKAIIDAD